MTRDLEQKPCDDCISREKVKSDYADWYGYGYKDNWFYKHLSNITPVTPQSKTGRWILTQRDKYIDINCSECGNTRIKDYAYGYTIDELNLDEIHDWFAKVQINYCECCGTKMESEVEK